MEEWRDIEEYEGLYQVSSLGRLSSEGVIKKTHLNKKGYLVITLYKDKKPKSVILHRLVAKAFIDNPLNLPQVNHIDGDKLNNRVINLEWCTNAANMEHSHRIGLRDHLKCRVDQYTLEGDYVRTYGSGREAGLSVGCNGSTIIGSTDNFYTMTAAGYRWRVHSDEVIDKSLIIQDSHCKQVKYTNLVSGEVVVYNSMIEASRQLDINYSFIMYHLAGKKGYNGKKLLEGKRLELVNYGKTS